MKLLQESCHVACTWAFPQQAPSSSTGSHIFRTEWNVNYSKPNVFVFTEAFCIQRRRGTQSERRRHVWGRSLNEGYNGSRWVNVVALAVRNGSCPRCVTCTRPWPSPRPSSSSTPGGKWTGSLRSCWAGTSPFLLWYLSVLSKWILFVLCQLNALEDLFHVFLIVF